MNTDQTAETISEVRLHYSFCKIYILKIQENKVKYRKLILDRSMHIHKLILLLL